MRGTEWNADLFRRQTRPRLHETRVRQQAGLFLSSSSRRWGEFLLDADRFFRDGFAIFKTPRLINFSWRGLVFPADIESKIVATYNTIYSNVNFLLITPGRFVRFSECRSFLNDRLYSRSLILSRLSPIKLSFIQFAPQREAKELRLIRLARLLLPSRVTLCKSVRAGLSIIVVRLPDRAC